MTDYVHDSTAAERELIATAFRGGDVAVHGRALPLWACPVC